jgi:UDP-arabinose 4-epimerase
LGTGQGTTVLEIANAVAKACNSTRAAKLGPRRAGDPPILIADAAKAKSELGWEAEMSDIDTIVRTAVEWYRLSAHRSDG